MRKIIDESTSVIFGFVSGIAFFLGAYLLLSNLFHYNYLQSESLFTKENTYYREYVSNVENINKNVDNYKYDASKFKDPIEVVNTYRDRIGSCYNKLTEKDSLYNQQDNVFLRDYDLYKYNEFFVNELVNECWVKNLADFYYNGKDYEGSYKYNFVYYNDKINNLVNEANYLKKELVSNYTMRYINDGSKMTSRDEAFEHLNLVNSLYDEFSKTIYQASLYLVDGEQMVMHND